MCVFVTVDKLVAALKTGMIEYEANNRPLSMIDLRPNLDQASQTETESTAPVTPPPTLPASALALNTSDVSPESTTEPKQVTPPQSLPADALALNTGDISPESATEPEHVTPPQSLPADALVGCPKSEETSEPTSEPTAQPESTPSQDVPSTEPEPVTPPSTLPAAAVALDTSDINNLVVSQDPSTPNNQP